MPRTPPSDFDNAVILPILTICTTDSGIRPRAKTSPALKNTCIEAQSSNQGASAHSSCQKGQLLPLFGKTEDIGGTISRPDRKAREARAPTPPWAMAHGVWQASNFHQSTLRGSHSCPEQVLHLRGPAVLMTTRPTAPTTPLWWPDAQCHHVAVSDPISVVRMQHCRRMLRSLQPTGSNLPWRKPQTVQSICSVGWLHYQPCGEASVAT